MRFEWTKQFGFSSSYADNNRVIGHNYILNLTTEAVDEASELRIESIVQKTLIDKMHSRDLSLDVDFLKGVTISDAALLNIFWKILEKELLPIRILGMSLQRDRRTITKAIP
jgi:hypothetical protein